MTNPYQPFFHKLDETLEKLGADADLVDRAIIDNAADLLKRAGYVLANTLNVQSQVYPTLFLSETTEDASTPSAEQPETVEGDDPQT